MVVSMIHPLSDVQSLKIGQGTQIWQYVVILGKAEIGQNCNINCHCFVENDVAIGNDVTIKSGVYLWDGITIEDNVFIGPNVTFTNDMNPRSKCHKKYLRTIIKKGASIGAGAVLTPGLLIGEFSLIGAGSIVTKSIKNNELWYGNPAKMHGYVCHCGARLNDKLRCVKCGKTYTKDKMGFILCADELLGML